MELEPYKTGNKYLNYAVAGWTFGAKLFLYTGPPFSVTNSSLAARINSGGGIGNAFIADVLQPSILGTSCGASSVNTACLNASSFAGTKVSATTPIAQLDFGNTAPDMFRGAGYFDIDTNINKGFKLTEKMTFGVGAQMYNVLNHPNFSNASGTVTSGSLGLISGTVGAPTSPYGSFQGASVSGRVMVITGKFTF